MAGTGKEASLEQRVMGFIKEQHLASGWEKLLVAVSGGPDSVCMLHVLLKLKKELGIDLHVAHLDHQLRGSESEADAQYVADLAQSLGLPCTIGHRDVKQYHASHHVTLEEAAREVRYAYLAEVARSIGVERVAVGHTVDDHVETILMHLIRGSGIGGLQGLKPVNRWQHSEGSIEIVRPLLKVSRQETADYCKEQDLKPRLDTSNLALASQRNRIRHELLPLLESYNPQVAEALQRNARIAGYDIDYLDREVERLYGNIVRKQENTLILSKKDLLALHPALKRHLLRTCTEKLLGSLMDIEERHIEEILETSSKPAGKRIDLPDGLTFTVEYDRYLLGFDPAALSPYPALEDEYKLNIPGSTGLPGWRIEAAISNAEGGGFPDNSLTACFDYDIAGSDLTVRHYKPGDRFQPLGMEQLKKVGEFMIDARIPRAWRKNVPIICSPGQVVWIVGHRIDERVKITADTRRVLHLEFKRR